MRQPTQAQTLFEIFLLHQVMDGGARDGVVKRMIYQWKILDFPYVRLFIMP